MERFQIDAGALESFSERADVSGEPESGRALRAIASRLLRLGEQLTERNEEVRKALRLAHEYTLETQDVETCILELCRLIAKARAERDALQAELWGLRDRP